MILFFFFAVLLTHHDRLARYSDRKTNLTEEEIEQNQTNLSLFYFFDKKNSSNYTSLPKTQIKNILFSLYFCRHMLPRGNKKNNTNFSPRTGLFCTEKFQQRREKRSRAGKKPPLFFPSMNEFQSMGEKFPLNELPQRLDALHVAFARNYDGKAKRPRDVTIEFHKTTKLGVVRKTTSTQKPMQFFIRWNYIVLVKTKQTVLTIASRMLWPDSDQVRFCRVRLRIDVTFDVQQNRAFETKSEKIITMIVIMMKTIVKVKIRRRRLGNENQLKRVTTRRRNPRKNK